MTAFKQTKQICSLDDWFTAYFLSVRSLLKQKKFKDNKAAVANVAPQSCSLLRSALEQIAMLVAALSKLQYNTVLLNNISFFHLFVFISSVLNVMIKGVLTPLNLLWK